MKTITTRGETVAKKVDNRKAPSRKTRRRRRTAGAKRNGGAKQSPSAGTLARTKELLLAAMRVWESKHRAG